MPLPLIDPSPDPDNFPLRPDHPDWRRLSILIQELTAEADAAGRQLDPLIEPVVDPESLAYLTFQRALRLLRLNTREEVVKRKADVARYATVYTEAFILGARYQTEKQGAER